MCRRRHRGPNFRIWRLYHSSESFSQKRNVRVKNNTILGTLVSSKSGEYPQRNEAPKLGLSFFKGPSQSSDFYSSTASFNNYHWLAQTGVTVSTNERSCTVMSAILDAVEIRQLTRPFFHRNQTNDTALS